MATARIAEALQTRRPGPTGASGRTEGERTFESLSDDEMYARALASDASCNGRFFIGVLTTGIYCLPSCHARKPFRRNVRFFPDVEAARAYGLRACKKCYPDDFTRGLDPLLDQVDALAAEVRQDPASFPDVGALVKRSGYGTTRLYQLFSLRFNLTPAEFLVETRLAAAKRLLHETDATVTDVAFAAGFASLTAFHQNFKRLTGQTPAAYRRTRVESPNVSRKASFTPPSRSLSLDRERVATLR